MDISRARRLVELEKEGRKILVTLWEGEKITTCATTEESKQQCETCQGDDELCDSYVDFLREKGYQATEIELGGGIEENLPKFLQEREVQVEPSIAMEPEVSEGAVAPADQALS